MQKQVMVMKLFKYNIYILYMDLTEFLGKYFALIILTIVIILAIVVFSQIFGLSFNRKRNQKVTKKVTFAAGI